MWRRLEQIYMPWADYGDLAFLRRVGGGRQSRTSTGRRSITSTTRWRSAARCSSGCSRGATMPRRSKPMSRLRPRRVGAVPGAGAVGRPGVAVRRRRAGGCRERGGDRARDLEAALGLQRPTWVWHPEGRDPAIAVRRRLFTALSNLYERGNGIFWFRWWGVPVNVFLRAGSSAMERTLDKREVGRFNSSPAHHFVQVTAWRAMTFVEPSSAIRAPRAIS